MKKKTFLLGVALSLCLLAASAFADTGKVGYVNMRKLFYEYDKTKNFNQELEKEDQRLKDEMQKKTDEIRKLRDEIDLLSEKAKEKRQPELQMKIQDLDKFRKEKLEGFIKKKDTMFQEIRNDIMSVAENFAKKNGYNMVFDEAVFVYVTSEKDITDALLKELNK